MDHFLAWKPRPTLLLIVSLTDALIDWMDPEDSRWQVGAIGPVLAIFGLGFMLMASIPLILPRVCLIQVLGLAPYGVNLSQIRWFILIVFGDLLVCSGYYVLFRMISFLWGRNRTKTRVPL